jgi:hypothetical protein
VLVVSDKYAILSRRNESKLPSPGEPWKHPPKSLELEDENGAMHSFTVESRPLREDGVEVMLTLVSQ